MHSRCGEPCSRGGSGSCAPADHVVHPENRCDEQVHQRFWPAVRSIATVERGKGDSWGNPEVRSLVDLVTHASGRRLFGKPCSRAGPGACAFANLDVHPGNRRHELVGSGFRASASLEVYPWVHGNEPAENRCEEHAVHQRFRPAVRSMGMTERGRGYSWGNHRVQSFVDHVAHSGGQ